MAIYNSNGNDTGGSGSYVSGTQGVQYLITSIAVAGDTVVIPNGTFTWNTGITCAKPIKIMGQTIGSCNLIWNNNTAASMITLTPQASGNIEFCNCNISASSSVTSHSGHFMFVNYASGSNGPPTTQPIAVHDCVFSTGSDSGSIPGNQVLSMILWSQNGGVIYNCTFNEHNTGTQTTNYDETIQFKNPGVDTWAYSSTMGLAGDPNGTYNTYLEDCTFNKCYTNCTDVDDGSRTVTRYCTWNESCAASHGFDTSPLGTRHWEFYNNHFVYPYGSTPTKNGTSNDPNATNVNAWIIMRGGTGVITNNTFCPQSSQNWGSGRKSVTWLSDSVTQGTTNRCYTVYPIPRAVGQGWNGGSGTYNEPTAWPPPLSGQIAWSTLTGYFTDPVYVWNNHTDNTYQTGSADTQGWIDNTGCPGGFTSAQFIVSGQDFFYNNTGTSAGAKPGWSPFTYPHPLRAQLAGSSSVNPRPVSLSSGLSLVRTRLNPYRPKLISSSVASSVSTTRLSGGGSGGNYSTNFTTVENPISDSGKWINGLAQGLVWTNVRVFANGECCGTMTGNESGNAQYADSTAVLTGTWGSEQSAQATVYVSSTPNASAEVEIRLRSSISSNVNTGYEINFSCSSAGGYVQIVRWNGGLNQWTLMDSRTAPIAVTGSTLKATITTVGTTAVIAAFINGSSTELFHVTDTNPWLTGSPGVGFYLHNQSGVSQNFGFSSFSATDGTSGGTIIYPGMNPSSLGSDNFAIKRVIRALTGWHP